MALTTALSGILGAQSDLDVISNNIANTDTTGFKASRAEFGDIFSSTAYNLSTVGVGGGTQLLETAQEFTQGDIETTGNSLDVAIDGNGFFTLDTGNGYVYSRAGDFQMDANGNVVSAEGYNLMVYPSTGSGTFDTSQLVDLNLDTSESSASPTTSATIIANLPASATAVTGTFSSGDATTYNDTTTFTAYDSEGEAHTVTVYYSKASGTTNTWDANVTVDGTDVTPSSGLTLTFDSNGQLETPADGLLSLASYTPSDGASAMSITLNFSGTTQYGTAYSAGTITQNGYEAGSLSSIDIGDDGIVTANYSNGQSSEVGQLAMANFTNEQGLAQVGDDDWKATTDSGQAIMGTADSGQFGNLESGALESSTTSDTTAQLVAMIQAQQAYQANAQVLSTDNTLSSDLMTAISR
ncbi:flagellar hook protein FlgE [Frateuria aurantia]